MRSSLMAYIASFRFLQANGLLWFLWFPLVISVLVIVGGFGFTSWATKIIADTIDVWINDAPWMPEWGEVIKSLIYWTIWIALRILLYFAFAFFGGSVILLLMAPVLTWLSEKVDRSFGDQAAPLSITQLTRDITRAAGLAVRNGLVQLGFSVLCLLVGLVPLVGFIAPFLLIGVNAYFFGFGFMDYSMERKNYTIGQSSAFAWRNKLSTLSLGLPFALWMIVPLIGPMTAGFVAVFATIAATLEARRLDSPTNHNLPR